MFLNFFYITTSLNKLFRHFSYTILTLHRKGMSALAGVTQWTERRPANQRDAVSIPGLGHMPGLQARSPGRGAREATTHWWFSPSPSTTLPLCLGKKRYVCYVLVYIISVYYVLKRVSFFQNHWEPPGKDIFPLKMYVLFRVIISCSRVLIIKIMLSLRIS